MYGCDTFLCSCPLLWFYLIKVAAAAQKQQRCRESSTHAKQKKYLLIKYEIASVYYLNCDTVEFFTEIKDLYIVIQIPP